MENLPHWWHYFDAAVTVGVALELIGLGVWLCLRCYFKRVMTKGKGQ